jgi:hypothetical protein
MRSKNIAITILTVLFIGSSALAYYFYAQLHSSKTDSNAAVQEQLNAIISKVGKLIELPEGETPTIATITDLSKIKDQPFFKRAKVGDKVIIYSKAAKAFLYDPTEDRLIEVAPLNTNPSAEPAKPAIESKDATSTKSTKSK